MSKSVQIQVTKPATKNARKPATKNPAQASQKPAESTNASPATLAYILTNRPGSGGPLFAYTWAWLTILGMDQGKPAPESIVRACAGSRAMEWHKQRFVHATDGTRLAAGAADFFDKGTPTHPRTRSPAMVQSFVELLTRGETDGPAAAYVKGAGNIRKI